VFWLLAGMLGAAEDPHGVVRAASGNQGLSHHPSQEQPGGTRAAAAPGFGHLPGDSARLRLDWDMGHGWPGRALGSWRLALLRCRWDRGFHMKSNL